MYSLIFPGHNSHYSLFNAQFVELTAIGCLYMALKGYQTITWQCHLSMAIGYGGWMEKPHPEWSAFEY